jgi:hypothetical protein
MTDEGGKQVGTGIDLSATKGSMSFSLIAEVLDHDEQHTYNVRVGLSAQ